MKKLHYLIPALLFVASAAYDFFAKNDNDLSSENATPELLHKLRDEDLPLAVAEVMVLYGTDAQNEEEVEIVSSAFNLQAGEPVVVRNHFTMPHTRR